MARTILKLHDDQNNKDYYLDWSSIVDAPVTFGMDLDEFKEYYAEEYGATGMKDFEDRMSRVECKGSSSFIYNSVEAVIECNRAGVKEECLSKEEIIRKYCKDRLKEERKA